MKRGCCTVQGVDGSDVFKHAVLHGEGEEGEHRLVCGFACAKATKYEFLELGPLSALPIEQAHVTTAWRLTVPCSKTTR